MEPSPLTQQARPDAFQPKIVQLYDELFKEDEEVEKPEGFWEEFFLLKPDAASLKRILSDLSPDDLLHLQAHPQQLVIRAIDRIKSGKAPSDEIALDTLTVFLGTVLTKKYTNPSSDIIAVLAGLHDADAVFSDFVSAIESALRNGRDIGVRQKAVKAALAMTSGAYSTGLVSYFVHRDLFPALMRFVQDSESKSQNLEAFVLLGLLANYNKFEFQNPYRLRLDDFVNDSSIQKIVQCAGQIFKAARDSYIDVQDDVPENWGLGSALAKLGLGTLAPGSKPSAPALAPEVAKERFAALPGPEAAILLSTYDFANANKLFCYTLVTIPADDKNDVQPFNNYLSFTSYLFQHAYRSVRASHYAYISLFIMQILVEDQALVKRMCSEESKASVRLCRQRHPFLPIGRSERTLTAVIIDIMVDCMNHNLRRRLDIQLYTLCLGVLHKILSFLARARIRLAYHWSELWRSLLSFVRFLTTYAGDLKAVQGVLKLVGLLVNLIALSLSAGESFLSDTAAYDDLFYKLVETGDILMKFRDAYELSKEGMSDSIDTLINVSRHYHTLLEDNDRKRSKNRSLNPREVHKIIQEGYETLSIQAQEGLDQSAPFRETEHKVVLKRTARIAINDATDLINKMA